MRMCWSRPSVSCLAGSKCPQIRRTVHPFIQPGGLPQGGQR
ncbi:hypothetical protein DUNSADRAFT_18537 [Dunaliella salina]|uniref:Uncharacterized protein n=1 Tax=Dunaliella salina TaxID=3046 RepID=A0ABQ7FZY0_DUNSA|nr:hypothetical protein DUNSADRAFT_18537 [Dunaliella salina]|eukprot:KAF5827909.1 hypothetical protein DUNSADRAFT_18537 [Dunaliella salina]